MSQSPLVLHIQSGIKLSNDEASLIDQAFSDFSIKKKKDLLRGGEICKYVYFVESGCLRSFSIDDKGSEHIYQIAFENHWISDLYSFLSQKPSRLFIEAIENTNVRVITLGKLNELYEAVPKLERFFRLLFQNAYISTMERYQESVRESARDRYEHLINNQPDLFQRVPLAYIASYLGITPESLSRIRKKL